MWLYCRNWCAEREASDNSPYVPSHNSPCKRLLIDSPFISNKQALCHIFTQLGAQPRLVSQDRPLQPSKKQRLGPSRDWGHAKALVHASIQHICKGTSATRPSLVLTGALGDSATAPWLQLARARFRLGDLSASWCYATKQRGRGSKRRGREKPRLL